MRSRVAVIAVVIGCSLSYGVRSSFAQGSATLERLLDVERQSDPKPVAAPAATRLAVPLNDDVVAARDLIRQAYEEDYAEASKAPRRLIDKLLQTAEQVQDSTRRYALLIEAERAAIEAGDIKAALEASSLRSQHFQIDPFACRLDVLIEATQNEQRDDPGIFRMFADLADEAMAAAQIDAAEKAATEAIATAKRVERSDRIAAAEERKRTGRKPQGTGQAPALMEEAIAIQRRVKDRRKAIAEYEAALGTLQQKPHDAAANGVVGRYRCFITGDWDEGLRSLAAGDSDPLRKVAGEDLRMLEEKQATPEQLLKVASEWWKLAEAGGIAPLEKEAMKRHAADLYGRALPDISDPIEQTLARKRMAAMDVEADRPSPKANPAARRNPARRVGGPLRIPASALLAAPADLSPALVALLPTEAEVAALQNHVNVEDRLVREAKNAYLHRVSRTFPIEAWTPLDAVYLIELDDTLNKMLGYSSTKASMAADWLLKAGNEQDFVKRMRSLPADAVGSDLEWYLSEGYAKKWLIQLGPEYSSTRRKLQAIQYLTEQGVASEGMRRYAEELAKAGTQP